MNTSEHEYDNYLAAASEQEKYAAAEKELINWLDKFVTLNVPLTQLAFILQFRTWDINRLAAEKIK